MKAGNDNALNKIEKEPGEDHKLVLEEVKKKGQMLLVKDAEIDGLKKYIKELRETLENEDVSGEL